MKFFSVIFLLLFTMMLSAQYQKGDWYIAGNTEIDNFLSLKNQTNTAGFSLSAYTPRIGYFFTDNLVVGVSGGIHWNKFQTGFGSISDSSIRLEPFARYYFPSEKQEAYRLFASAGFGTFNTGVGNFFQTNFYLELGAEKVFLPGALATVLLRHEVSNGGLNYTTLNFSLNVLLGQLIRPGAESILRSGVFTTQGNIGSLRYGLNSSGEFRTQIIDVDCYPALGYFITSRLHLEGRIGMGLRISDYDRPANSLSQTSSNSSTYNTAVTANLSYFMKNTGRLLPYFSVGISYNRLRTKSTNEFGSRKFTTALGRWQIGGGVNYFISPQVAIDATLKYSKSRGERNFSNSISLSQSLHLNAGLRFFFVR